MSTFSLTRLRATPTRSVLSFCLAGVLLSALSCMAPKRSRIVPPQAAPSVKVSGNRVSVRLEKVEIGLELLDAAARTRFLQKRGVAAGRDPFAPDPHGKYRFVTFRLDLINRSQEEINVHPSSLQAVTDVIPHFPLEYTGFYMHFVSRLRLTEVVLEDLERAVIMSNVEVPAGKRMSGLLVFQGLPKRFKRFRISCSSILVGPESRTFTVPFDVVQEKVPKERKS